jgi:hypothetical protein
MEFREHPEQQPSPDTAAAHEAAAGFAMGHVYIGRTVVSETAQYAVPKPRIERINEAVRNGEPVPPITSSQPEREGATGGDEPPVEPPRTGPPEAIGDDDGERWRIREALDKERRLAQTRRTMRTSITEFPNFIDRPAPTEASGDIAAVHAAYTDSIAIKLDNGADFIDAVPTPADPDNPQAGNALALEYRTSDSHMDVTVYTDGQMIFDVAQLPDKEGSRAEVNPLINAEHHYWINADTPGSALFDPELPAQAVVCKTTPNIVFGPETGFIDPEQYALEHSSTRVVSREEQEYIRDIIRRARPRSMTVPDVRAMLLERADTPQLTGLPHDDPINPESSSDALERYTHIVGTFLRDAGLDPEEMRHADAALVERFINEHGDITTVAVAVSPHDTETSFTTRRTVLPGSLSYEQNSILQDAADEAEHFAEAAYVETTVIIRATDTGMPLHGDSYVSYFDADDQEVAAGSRARTYVGMGEVSALRNLLHTHHGTRIEDH